MVPPSSEGKVVELIRVVNLQDLKAAYAIREQVFVAEQQVPREDEYDAFEDISHHYLATFEGVPCGTARWRTTDKGVKLERFAILSEYRSKQVGSQLLQVVLQDVRATYPEKNIYLHAQLPALGFYRHHGFEAVGLMFIECGIIHFKMLYRG